MKNPLIIAYELGYRSGVEGEDPRLCPYSKMTAEWKAWNQAHNRGVNVRSGVEVFALRHASSELR